jgi:hypothetical protein
VQLFSNPIAGNQRTDDLPSFLVHGECDVLWVWVFRRGGCSNIRSRGRGNGCPKRWRRLTGLRPWIRLPPRSCPHKGTLFSGRSPKRGAQAAEREGERGTDLSFSSPLPERCLRTNIPRLTHRLNFSTSDCLPIGQ